MFTVTCKVVDCNHRILLCETADYRLALLIATVLAESGDVDEGTVRIHDGDGTLVFTVPA